MQIIFKLFQIPTGICIHTHIFSGIYNTITLKTSFYQRFYPSHVRTFFVGHFKGLTHGLRAPNFFQVWSFYFWENVWHFLY